MKKVVGFLVVAAMVVQGGTAWAWGRNRCENPVRLCRRQRLRLRLRAEYRRSIGR